MLHENRGFLVLGNSTVKGKCAHRIHFLQFFYLTLITVVVLENFRSLWYELYPWHAFEVDLDKECIHKHYQ